MGESSIYKYITEYTLLIGQESSNCLFVIVQRPYTMRVWMLKNKLQAFLKIIIMKNFKKNYHKIFRPDLPRVIEELG